MGCLDATRNWGYRIRIAGGHAQGGKTCLYSYFGGAKTLFSYINLQCTYSDGGQNHAKFFIWGQCPQCPMQVRACVDARKGIFNNLPTRPLKVGGATPHTLSPHSGGAKTLFSYINLQCTYSDGGQNHAKFFIWGQCPQCPMQVRACVDARKGIFNNLPTRPLKVGGATPHTLSPHSCYANVHRPLMQIMVGDLHFASWLYQSISTTFGLSQDLLFNIKNPVYSRLSSMTKCSARFKF